MKTGTNIIHPVIRKNIPKVCLVGYYPTRFRAFYPGILPIQQMGNFGKIFPTLPKTMVALVGHSTPYPGKGISAG